MCGCHSYLNFYFAERRPIDDHDVYAICKEKIKNNMNFDEIKKSYNFININELQYTYDNICVRKTVSNNDLTVCQHKFEGMSVEKIIENLNFGY